jgi:poly(3-hydroxybutyrate) depolymerase
MPQVFMSGYSNGGMMLQTALCSSPRLMRLVKAVALAKSSINQR